MIDPESPLRSDDAPGQTSCARHALAPHSLIPQLGRSLRPDAHFTCPHKRPFQRCAAHAPRPTAGSSSRARPRANARRAVARPTTPRNVQADEAGADEATPLPLPRRARRAKLACVRGAAPLRRSADEEARCTCAEACAPAAGNLSRPSTPPASCASEGRRSGFARRKRIPGGPVLARWTRMRQHEGRVCSHVKPLDFVARLCLRILQEPHGIEKIYTRFAGSG